MKTDALGAKIIFNLHGRKVVTKNRLAIKFLDIRQMGGLLGTPYATSMGSDIRVEPPRDKHIIWRQSQRERLQKCYQYQKRAKKFLMDT